MTVLRGALLLAMHSISQGSFAQAEFEPLLCMRGEVLVAGLSNEEFASNFRRIALLQDRGEGPRAALAAQGRAVALEDRPATSAGSGPDQ